MKTLLACLSTVVVGLQGAAGFAPSNPRYSHTSISSDNLQAHQRQRVPVTSTSLFGFPEPPQFDRPDPSILVSAKPGSEQQDAVFALTAGIIGGTILCINLLNGFESVLPDGW